MGADDGIKIFSTLLAAFGPVGALVTVYAGWVTYQRERLVAQIAGYIPAEVEAKVTLNATLTKWTSTLERIAAKLDHIS